MWSQMTRARSWAETGADDASDIADTCAGSAAANGGLAAVDEIGGDARAPAVAL